MKYSGSSFSVLLVSGYNLAAAVMNSATMGRESITEQTNPFGAGAASEEHTPIGITKGTLVAGGGLYDEAQDALHTAFSTVSASLESFVLPFTVIRSENRLSVSRVYSQKYEVMDEKDGPANRAPTGPSPWLVPPYRLEAHGIAQRAWCARASD